MPVSGAKRAAWVAGEIFEELLDVGGGVRSHVSLEGYEEAVPN